MTRWGSVLQQVDEFRWEIPTSYKRGMRVPGRIYANRELLEMAADELAFEQVANVAFLPGIVWRSLAMPDIHEGYGFPIGGVAAMRLDDGVVSPGGVGFDINCGTRIVLTNLAEDDVRARLRDLANQLFRDIPAGLGGHGALDLTDLELEDVMRRGAAAMIERGYGRTEDLERIESEGCLDGADPRQVSQRARDRGRRQLGTLGSGNHFLEVQAVEDIFDAPTAERFGFTGRGQVVVFLHTGSRGFGHQICQDFLDRMEAVQTRYGITLPDRQLACAPILSSEGGQYLAAMAAAANYAFANRQCITELARRAFARIFGRDDRALGMDVLYDVAHNSAKIEQHSFEGQHIDLCVHRKGATRAFPAGHEELPDRYRDIGQPVLVPGDMGRYSYVAVGLETAMQETWGSVCHGAGRVRSRHAAKRMLRGVNVAKRLEARGIIVRAQNPRLLAEEASEAYKDVTTVVDVLEAAGIARKVARLRPLAVIKG